MDGVELRWMTEELDRMNLALCAVEAKANKLTADFGTLVERANALDVGDRDDGE